MSPNGNSARTTAFPHLTGVGNPFQAIGFAILMLFLFILFSRTFDVVLSALQIPFSISCLTLAATVFSGGILRCAKHKIGRYLIAFTVWMAIGLPFSFWRAGSMITFQGWLKAFLVYVCIVGLIGTYQQTKRAVTILGFALVTLSVIALVIGNTESGRLFLSAGKFQNPNDLAQIIVIGLPFLWLMIRDSSHNLLFRLPPLLLSGVIIYVLLRTGSRGGIIGFLAMLGFAFFRSSMAERMGMIVLSMVLIILALAVVPSAVRSRYATLFSSDSADDSQLANSAAASSESRQILLKRSIAMTFQHPVLGVGAGMFAEAVEAELLAQGIRTAFLVSHNSYTQISSEMGFPGLFLYVAVLYSCFKATKAVEKICSQRLGPRWRTIREIANCLRMSLVAFSVTALFSSVAYQSVLPTVAGLCTALYLSVQDELAQDAARMPVAVEETSLAHRPLPSAPRLPSPAGQGI